MICETCPHEHHYGICHAPITETIRDDVSFTGRPPTGLKRTILVDTCHCGDRRTRTQRAMDDAVKLFDVPYQAFADFNLKKGDRIAFERDGVTLVGVISSIDENEVTGEIKIKCADQSPGWDAITQPVGTILDGILP